MKRVAIIPVLLGSTRIPDKNLLLVDGYPLVFYVAKACRDAGVFDAIYINSENAIFETMARMLDVKFYRRDPAHGGSACTMRSKSSPCAGARCQTHDHFLIDFMDAVPAETLTMVHATSPLLQAGTIRGFVETLERDGYDSLFSVEERYTETLHGDSPLNFSFARKVPTQTLPPVRSISWALSGWRTAAFAESYRRDDPAENGPTFCGKTGFFPLNRIEALDCDTWDDFFVIEAALRHRRQKQPLGVHRFSKRVTGIENDLPDLIARDGVTRFEGASANARHVNIDDIKRRMGPAPWLYLLVYSGEDQTALICQEPGEGARRHCHVTHDEWWVVLEGRFEWRLADGTTIVGNPGDVICLSRGTVHSIVCTSERPGIRLACGGRDFEHVYVG